MRPVRRRPSRQGAGRPRYRNHRLTVTCQRRLAVPGPVCSALARDDGERDRRHHPRTRLPHAVLIMPGAGALPAGAPLAEPRTTTGCGAQPASARTQPRRRSSRPKPSDSVSVPARLESACRASRRARRKTRSSERPSEPAGVSALVGGACGPLVGPP
jgi:hypothetical protein